MDIQQSVRRLDELERRMTAYHYAVSIVYYDSETVAPAKSVQGRSDCLALLSEERYKLFFNDEVGALLAGLYDVREDLDYPTRRRVEKLKEDYDKNHRIPMDEYVAFQVLTSEAEVVWRAAKSANDFDAFAPYLQKIFDTVVRFAGYMQPGADPYEVWLNEHEKGLTRAMCDDYFAKIKAALVPLIKEVSARPQPDGAFLDDNTFPLDKQRALSAYLMDLMTIPPERCVLGEVEHPFSMSLNIDDVRMTTHYYENSLLSSMYSVIHEGGHSLYSMGSDPAYRNTCLAYPSSTSVHESQSRFFENYIGRSEQYLTVVLPKLQELFPEQFAGVTAHQLYLAANRAMPSLIRIEADELTYSMHIVIRYEIEKMLFDGEIGIADLPQVWNRLYKENLGVDIPDNARGVLQDTHWSGGSFGYFPSYSLGSAYAAQMLDAMRQDLDVYAAVANGDLAPIVAWLGERVHRDGGAPIAQDIIQKACGAPFSPQYYIDYLTQKYTAIYGLA